MYQIVVIGLAVTLLFGGFYFIKKTDSNGSIEKSLSNQSTLDATTTEDTTSNTDIYNQ